MRRNLKILAIVAALGIGESAWSQECAVTVEGNDMVQFVQKELKVSSSCSEITVTLKHIGTLAANIMGHNFVLSKTADYMAVAQAGQAAGAPDYLPAGDARVIAATDVIGGGMETSITIDASVLQAGGDYTFFCSFPGHFVLMNGKFIVE